MLRPYSTVTSRIIAGHTWFLLVQWYSYSGKYFDPAARDARWDCVTHHCVRHKFNMLKLRHFGRRFHVRLRGISFYVPKKVTSSFTYMTTHFEQCIQLNRWHKDILLAWNCPHLCRCVSSFLFIFSDMLGQCRPDGAVYNASIVGIGKTCDVEDQSDVEDHVLA